MMIYDDDEYEWEVPTIYPGHYKREAYEEKGILEYDWDAFDPSPFENAMKHGFFVQWNPPTIVAYGSSRIPNRLMSPVSAKADNLEHLTNPMPVQNMSLEAFIVATWFQFRRHTIVGIPESKGDKKMKLRKIYIGHGATNMLDKSVSLLQEQGTVWDQKYYATWQSWKRGGPTYGPDIQGPKVWATTHLEVFLDACPPEVSFNINMAHLGM